MKTALEFWAAFEQCLHKDEELKLIEARDAEHIAESKAREETLRAERDRLQGLLREQAENCAHRAMSERLSNQVESERALRAIVEDERDRLKGELAEARRVMGPYREYDEKWEGGRLAKFLAAPSPAESTGAHERVTCETVPRGEWCFGCGEPLTATNRHTADGCMVQQPAAPSPAESTGVHINEALPEDCPGCIAEQGKYEAQLKPAAPPDDIRDLDNEWKRSLKNEIATRFREHNDHERRLKALEEWARRQVAEPWFDPEKQPAAPQAQAPLSELALCCDPVCRFYNMRHTGSHTGARP